MKNLLFLVMMWAISSISHSQNNIVYYYERVKVVKQGVQQPMSGDGHYLAINQNGLYESNITGGSMGKGFVKYINSNNGRPLYEGSAYLGQNLSYVFNSDYSRLNLHIGDGTIYVYERRNGPSSKGMERIYQSGPVVVSIPDGTPNPSTSSDTKRPEKKKYITCAYCKGTGRRTLNTDGGIRKNQYWVTCSECGFRHLNTTLHRHVSCVYCNGTGQRRLD